MSVTVMALVYKARLGCVYRKAVALKLADCADDDGRNIWPAVATIAAQAEVSERSVQNKLAELVALGLIEVVKLGGGAGVTTCYRFQMMRLYDLAARRLAVDDGGDGLRLVPSTDATTDATTPASTDENGAPGAPIGEDEKGAPRAPLADENPAPGAKTPHATTENPAPGAPDPSGTIIDPSSPPLPPAGGRRGRGIQLSEIEQVLHSLRTDCPPEGRRVVDLLLAPVVLQRKLDSPSQAGALKSLADWAKARGASDAVLRAAAEWLIATRKATVKPADFQAALTADHVLAADQVWLDRGSPEWLAWVGWHEARPDKRSLVPHIRDCSRWSFASRWPPGHVAAPQPEAAP